MCRVGFGGKVERVEQCDGFAHRGRRGWNGISATNRCSRYVRVARRSQSQCERNLILTTRVFIFELIIRNGVRLGIHDNGTGRCAGRDKRVAKR